MQRRPRATLGALAALVVLVGAVVMLAGRGDDGDTTELVTEDASTTTTEATATTAEPTTTSSSTTATTVPETTTSAAPPITQPPPPPTTAAPVTTQPPAPAVRPIVAVQVSSPQGLVRMNPDGSNRVLIASGQFQTPVLSRDGQWVAAVRGSSPGELVTMRIDGGSLKVAPGSWQSPSFSPNGAELVAVKWLEGPDLQLVRMNRDLSSPHPLPRPSNYALGMNQVDWSPNGKHLAITNNSSQGLGIYDLATGQATTIRPGVAIYPRFSPDGSRIAFTSSSKVVVMAAGGGADAPIASGDGPVTWQTSSRVYFGSGQTVYAVNADGSGLSPVAQGVMHPAG